MLNVQYHIFSEKMLTTKKIELDDSTEIEIFSFSQWKLFRHFIAQKPFKPQKVVKWTSTEWLLMKCFLRPPTLFPYLTKFNITECQLGIIIFPEASLEWKLGGKFLKPIALSTNRIFIFLELIFYPDSPQQKYTRTHIMFVGKSSLKDLM